ncbi:hypothetical protein EC991_003777 [Linnemannia zychae]|nr:hypothetical protein EC991_003777 [Linnemannia zychae]
MYIREAIWSSDVRGNFSKEEMLDILFDCNGVKQEGKAEGGLPLDVSPADSVSTGRDLDNAAKALLDSRSSVTTGGEGEGGVVCRVEPTIRLGPNCLPLQRFEFKGEVGSIWLFETTIYNMSLLTTLVLTIECQSVNYRWIPLDVDRILDAMPRLKNLHTRGNYHTYVDASPPSDTAWPPPMTFSRATLYESKLDKEVTIHPLESLTVSQFFMTRPAPNLLATFKRLGNLKSLNIESEITFFDPVSRRTQPGEFGQILQKCCPKIDTIRTYGRTALWLFRLPRFSPAIEAMVSSVLEAAGSWAPSRAAREKLEMELQDQEIKDILTLREEIPFFPRLTTFASLLRPSLGAQDLLALAVQSSKTLTHLTLDRTDDSTTVYNLLQKPSPSNATAAEGIDQITVYPLGYMAAAEKLRLRQRRPCNDLDYEMVLEICTCLKSVSLPGGIHFRHMIDVTTQYADDGVKAAGAETKTMRRWACEETLESLEVGFILSTAIKSDHRLVWRHLGRLRKLRSLNLTHSNLIPSLDFGIGELVGLEQPEDALAEGVDGVEEGVRSPEFQPRLQSQNETLKEIHSLGNTWGVDDQQTVEWFARSFPNLTTLGLGFQWDKPQHRRVTDWLSNIVHSFELVFINDRFRKKKEIS